jgi:hypothetical protein
MTAQLQLIVNLNVNFSNRKRHKGMTRKDFINKWENSDWGIELCADFDSTLKDELIKFQVWCEDGSQIGITDIKFCTDVVNEYIKLQENNQLLPCGENGCVNPHEKIYRGCDICKFNKSQQK